MRHRWHHWSCRVGLVRGRKKMRGAACEIIDPGMARKRTRKEINPSMRGHGNAVGFRCQAQFISLPSACSEYLPLLFLSTEQSPPLETPNTGAARPVLASRLPPKKGDAATAYAEAKRTKRAATDRIFFCRCYILLAGRGVMKGSDLSVAIEKLYHTGLVDAASILSI